MPQDEFHNSFHLAMINTIYSQWNGELKDGQTTYVIEKPFLKEQRNQLWIFLGSQKHLSTVSLNLYSRYIEKLSRDHVYLMLLNNTYIQTMENGLPHEG